MVPDKRKRSDKSKNGGASNIAILADVKALDHIMANNSPKIISRILIFIKS